MRAYLPLFALLPLAGCASEPFDELAGRTEPSVAESSGTAYAYFEITPDLRKCASPMCGGYFFSRLNQAPTRCPDGAYRDACYVPQLDWTEANLSASLQSELLVAAQRDARSTGVYAIVRGRFAPPCADGDRFVITEAWVAAGDTVSDGAFVRVEDNGMRCFAAPCPNLTEHALNTSRWTNIAEVDFTLAKLSGEQIERLQEQLYTPGGILVVGHRYLVDVDGRTAKGRTATAAYTRLVDTSDPQ